MITLRPEDDFNMMRQSDLSESKSASTDSAKQSVQLGSEYDRVRCCEWIRKINYYYSMDVRWLEIY